MEMGGIHFIHTAIQYFRLDYSDWLSSEFLKPGCTLESPGELLTNPLVQTHPRSIRIFGRGGGEHGAWASGDSNVQAGLRITGL